MTEFNILGRRGGLIMNDGTFFFMLSAVWSLYMRVIIAQPWAYPTFPTPDFTAVTKAWHFFRKVRGSDLP